MAVDVFVDVDVDVVVDVFVVTKEGGIPMSSLAKLTLVLAFVATAAVASLVTLLLAPSSALHAQGLVTTKAPEVAAGGPWTISAYGYVEAAASRREDAKWTLGFFALNERSGKVSNCIYMWSGSPTAKCMDYAWVKLPE